MRGYVDKNTEFVKTLKEAPAPKEAEAGLEAAAEANKDRDEETAASSCSRDGIMGAFKVKAASTPSKAPVRASHPLIIVAPS
jgi:hypothetical protein